MAIGTVDTKSRNGEKRAMRVWKDALYPGRWHLPDGREFDCQPGDIEHYARRVQDMLAAGLHVPLAWEHQDVGPVPLSDAEKIAERTKLTMGHLTGSRVAPQGHLELQLEVPDEEDLKRLGKIRFVSPEIHHDYTDPSGRPWDGPTIYHVAATSRPIQYTQQPFMLSDPASAPIRLSLDGYEAMNNTKHRKPVRLADDDNDSGESSDKPETSAEQVSDEDRVQDVIAKLADLGIMLPDDTNKENFFDRVVGSLLTKAANNDEAPPPPPPEEPAIEEDEPAPMPMGLSEQFRSLKHENQALKAHVMGLKRKDILRRIKALEGQVPASIYHDLASRANKVQLSLAQNGELANNNFLVELSAYERVAKAGSPFLRNGHNGHEQDVPLSESGYVQPQGDDETADEMLGLIGRQRRKRN